MSVRLQFPRGSSFSFLRQFVRDGAPVDITGKTLSAYLKNSSVDADADKIAALTIAAVNAPLGIVRITIPGATTASLVNCLRYFWQARADLTGGDILAPEALQGPIELTPFQDLNTLPMPTSETLTPSETSNLTALTSYNFVGVKASITTAAEHRALATVGATLPWVILTLESGVWQTWTLRTRAGEVDDGTSYRVPDDYNASTNPVIWIHTATA